MKNFVKAAAVICVCGGVAADCKGSDPPATIAPRITAQQVPANQGGGTVITPSVQANVPVGKGVSVHGNVQVPVYVPSSGAPVVTSPSVGVGVTIPINP